MVAWFNVPWGRSRFEMAMLSKCSHFLISAGRGAVLFWTPCDNEDAGLAMWMSGRCRVVMVCVCLGIQVAQIHNHQMNVLINTFEQHGARPVQDNAYLRVSVWNPLIPCCICWLGDAIPNDDEISRHLAPLRTLVAQHIGIMFAWLCN